MRSTMLPRASFADPSRICGSRNVLRFVQLSSHRSFIPLSAQRPGSSQGDFSSSSTPPDDWLNSLNKNSSFRDPLLPGPESPTDQDWIQDLLGKDTVLKWSEIEKEERQRVWDCMRLVARERYEKGEMPPWFDPRWIDQDEAPVNQLLREDGWSNYQYDDTWLGGNGGSSGGTGGKGRGGEGWNWWREDDPYWPLRDWGDHPMRWWTLAAGAVLCVGGVLGYCLHGCIESLIVGNLSGAALITAAMAMSDMTHLWYGAAGVKVAWATCALLTTKELWYGWKHWERKGRREGGSSRGLGGCGFMCLVLALSYMLTDMSGLSEHHLGPNPGSVFKSTDIAQKSMVWNRWGYGSVPMA